MIQGWMGIQRIANKAYRNSRLFNRRQSGSLVRRFQLLLLLWGLSVYFIAVCGFWFVSTALIETTLQRQTTQWIEKIDTLSTPLYISNNKNEFAPVQAFVRNIKEIAYLNLYDTKGDKLIASYINDELNTDTFEFLSDQALAMRAPDVPDSVRKVFDKQLNEKNIVRIIHPVAIASMDADELLDFDLDRPEDDKVSVIGHIELGVDYSFYQLNLLENIIKASAYILVLFLGALIFGRILIKKALKPLLELREPLEKLARGDTDVWVSRGGDVEIVAISNALSTTISAIKGRDAELRRLADFDSLTGLFNKRSFMTLFEKECSRIASDNDTGALLFIDLDQFKHVNDSLGHTAGDRLLVEIAGLLKKGLRANDIVSRMGGDEFAVLVTSINKEGAIELANAILEGVGNYLHVEAGKTFTIGCSIGIAMIEGKQYSPEDIFSHADMACYTAKSQGRNRHHLYKPSLVDKHKLDIGWSQRITWALSEDNFKLNYQPIINAGNRETDAYEVLVRLVDNGKILLPGLFMSVAERFGLASEIDYFVIAKAVELLKLEQAESRNPRLHINLSAQILNSPDFIERLLLMAGNKAIIQGLVFEVAEQTVVMNVSSITSTLKQLKAHGFIFAIDKFGSGLNSFSYLRHMPVDYVKVSGEFIEKMMEDEVDRAMVESIITVAAACKKKIIAAYVPCNNTLEMLQELGVDSMQGNFICEPQTSLMPASVEKAIAGSVTAFPAG